MGNVSCWVEGCCYLGALEGMFRVNVACWGERSSYMGTLAGLFGVNVSLWEKWPSYMGTLDRLLAGTYHYSGQKCCNMERAIVHLGFVGALHVTAYFGGSGVLTFPSPNPKPKVNKEFPHASNMKKTSGFRFRFEGKKRTIVYIEVGVDMVERLVKPVVPVGRW